jgi:hypothetical protein
MAMWSVTARVQDHQSYCHMHSYNASPHTICEYSRVLYAVSNRLNLPFVVCECKYGATKRTWSAVFTPEHAVQFDTEDSTCEKLHKKKPYKNVTAHLENTLMVFRFLTNQQHTDQWTTSKQQGCYQPRSNSEYEVFRRNITWNQSNIRSMPTKYLRYLSQKTSVWSHSYLQPQKCFISNHAKIP